MGQCLSLPHGHAAREDSMQGMVLHGKTVGNEPLPVALKMKQDTGGSNDCSCPAIDLDTAQPVTNPDTDLILNMLDPENGPASGLPYQVHWLGPPRPPCEKRRLETVHALDKLNKSDPDPEISTILKLVASVFKAPAALCALFDEKQVFISEQEGNVIPCGDFPWRWTLCGWSMAFKNPQILVIQDTLEDARFANNMKVKAFPFVRFYCGAPLVAANGHRLGTLCFADVKPRKFDMASCVMMNNMSELVVRQLEKNIALKLKEKDNQSLLATYKNLQRAMNCYDNVVVLLDTTEPGWKVVYANAAWSKQTGVSRDKLLSSCLADVLEVTDGTQLPSMDLTMAVKKMKDYTVGLTRLKDPNVTKTFTAIFKPAGRQTLDDSTIPIGVPNFLSAEGGEDDVAHRFYFLTLSLPNKQPSRVSSALLPAAWPHSAASNSLCSGSSAGADSIISGLELAHLLGRGSFGWVYYGSWYGTPVAVKVVDEDSKTPFCGSSMSGNSKGSSSQNPQAEASLSHDLRHPFIVQTLKYATRAVPCGRAPDLEDYLRRTSLDHGDVVSCVTPTLTGTSIIHSSADNASSSVITSAAVHSGFEAVTFNSHDAASGDAAAAGHGHAGGGWAVIQAGGESPAVADLDYQDEVDSDDLEVLRACQVRTDAWAMELEPSASQQANAVMPPATAGRKGGVTEFSCVNASGTHAHASAAGAGGVATMQQTWMVMEFCDRGCLQDAIDRGWLRTARDCLHSQAHMEAVVSTAFEIASAMNYLHQHDVVHGDLTGWNVLLSSCGSSAGEGSRGWVAKVCDFGMSRVMELRSRITTKNYGTITHMPPELLTAGAMSKAVDVFSFGVLLWQMFHGSRPWSGLTHAQIIMRVVTSKQQLQWDRDAPSDMRKLAQDCMAYSPDARPTFEMILDRLHGMREEMGLA